MKIDFHAHILPGIDDGAKNTDESLELMSMLKEDGVDIVVATPHLYLHEKTAGDFLREREDAYLLLSNAVKKYLPDAPKIILGAELYFSTALIDMPLKELCIEGTDYILIELPYQRFSTAFINTFHDFVNYSDRQIILAHIERYFQFNDSSDISKILSNDVIAQFNCDSVLNSAVRKKFWKLLFEGYIHIMGSDAHDPFYRPPRFAAAETFLRRKFGNREVERLFRAGELVLDNAPMAEILNLRQHNF